MTRFEVKIDCNAVVLDDRTQAYKGGRCHKVVSGGCARDRVLSLINEAAGAAGSSWKGYNALPLYSSTGYCRLRNGNTDGLTDNEPTRTWCCHHTAIGRVYIYQPAKALVRQLNQMGFRQK